MKRQQSKSPALGVAVLFGAIMLLAGCGGNATGEAPRTDPALDASTVPPNQDEFAEPASLPGRLGEDPLPPRAAAVEPEPVVPVERTTTPAPKARVPATPGTTRTEPRLTEPEPNVLPEEVLVRLEAGTELDLEFRDSPSSETSQAGDPVRATLARDVIVGGVVTLPAGSEVFGTVVEAVPQKHIGGRSRLSIRFDRIHTPDGADIDIQASAEFAGKAQGKKDAATIGGAAAGGAVLGRILSKNDKTKGTAVGAVVGAAVGTAVASQNQGDPVTIESGSAVKIALDSPVEVSVSPVEG